ncbi:CheB methylesterase [Arcticibacter pallidicorallinus]|uniref:protein-glutamate methylesterase n=1 Tax=Arcticibacter pallidicorallinus TaxID=1259464 RepID=A0A2T0U3D6_9SPHI|nr:chemotaxis protein CheB [Arcticibacter pallidicorallinus]PRY52426.1 CheB methylesterase [Arcticibacter pallidicorallinus]
MEKDSLNRSVEILVIAGSAGSLDVILKMLPRLDVEVNFPIIVVLHRKASYDSSLADLLATRTTIPVVEAEEKDQLRKGVVYLAPADYHLLIESDRSLSLDYSEKIQYSRPCIDVTLENVAEVYKDRAAAILLSGANSDGAKGLKRIKQAGGITAVQNPATAEVSFMPNQALQTAKIDYVLEVDEIAYFINKLSAMTF